MSPEGFLAEYENASCLELLKLKNELVQSISEFEKDYEMKNPDWNMNPSPDVRYQWNLEVLSSVASMLHEAFNRDYEMGEKSISDFYREIKK